MSHDVSRRAALRSIGIGAAVSTLAAGAAVASVSTAGADDDAELIRLGAEFDRLYAEWLPLEAEYRRCAELRDKAWNNLGAKFSLEAYRACCDWAGATAAEEAEAPVLDRLDSLSEHIHALPARTFRGIAIKLRVVRYCAFGAKQATDDFDELNWDLRCLVLVQREAEALAAGGAL